MGEARELAGKVALVTGGGRGIGRAIALALEDAGATVAVADLEAGECTGVFHRLDVSDFDAASSVIKTVAQDLGGLHVLVNNAGITSDQMMGRMKPEQWKQVIDVNLGGCFNCSRAATRIMLRQRAGRIINVSSIVARLGRPGQANYVASKAGIEGLTRTLALELGHRQITVNAIAPGYVDTEMTRALPEQVQAEILAGIPLGRAGKPEDVARMVVFLAGPGGAYVTGQTLAVNGGLYFG